MATRKEAGTDRQAVEYGDQRVERGYGGEVHQVASGDSPRLTTQQGIMVSDDQNTLRAGERGPAALEDFHFREKIFHFDHERIPERVVHARGYGAHGYFENYEPLGEITRADPFSEAGLRTPVFVRFSTVAGSSGSSDLARDVRGFATKFYTREGNWDLVGNNIPVFFIQDAVVVLASKQGASMLAALPAARDFMTDAFAHCKFIAYGGETAPLFEAAGLGSLIDDGFADLERVSAAEFISRCAELRFWPRQASIAEKAAAAHGRSIRAARVP